MHEANDLGNCCICEGEGATVIVALTARAPTGHGWGCLQCDLPTFGAMAVLCAACAGRYAPGESWRVELDLRWACRGYPSSEGRMPFEDLRGEHVHIRSKHPEEVEQIPPMTIAASDTRFEQHVEEGRGCFCSRCGQTIYEGCLAIRAWPEHGTYAYRFHPVCFGALPSPEDPYEEGDAWL
jgi:hypothetical protein